MLYGVQGGVDAGSRTLKSMIRKEPIVVQRHRVIKGREYTDWMSYCGSLPGHKFRFCAQTRTGALEKANAFLMRYRLGDGLFEGRLSGRRLFDALHALALLAECNAQTTLTELAHDHRRREGFRRSGMGVCTLGELFRRHAAALPEAGVRNRNGYRWVARALCGALGAERPAETLTEADFRTLLERYANPASRNALVRRLQAVFRWGVREHLLSSSPVETLRLLPQNYHEPDFLRVDTVERILRVAEAHPGDPAHGIGICLTLGFFAGIRSAEIARARWEDLDLEAHVFRVSRPKGYQQGTRPRLVELEPNACAWLSKWKRLYAAAGHACRGRILAHPWHFTAWKRTYLQPAGLSWGRDVHHNAMRHTYATMHVGAFRNAPATALNHGHSRGTDMLERHYRWLVSQAEARRYWELYPAGATPLPRP